MRVKERQIGANSIEGTGTDSQKVDVIQKNRIHGRYYYHMWDVLGNDIRKEGQERTNLYFRPDGRI